MRQILTIQYLRGIAACSVAFHHIVLVYAPKSGWDIGSFGVDIFFVVSGFIMILVSRSDEASFGNFMLHRLVRIVPLYWFVTIILAICALFKPNLFPLSLPTTWHMLGSLLFIPHTYLDTGLVQPLLMQGWTLNFEMYFYLIVGLALFAPRRFQLRIITAVFGAYLLIGSVVEINYNVPQNYIFGSFPLVAEFLGGAYLGSLWGRDLVPGLREGWALLCFGCAALLAEEIIGFNVGRWSRVLPCILILAGALTLERHIKVPSIAPLKALGDSSYSIYLTHSFPMVAMGIVMVRLGLSPSLFLFGMTFLLQILLGIACYWTIERPLLVGAREMISRVKYVGRYRTLNP
jgi:exopolysaccharide production protein ExoZ